MGRELLELATEGCGSIGGGATAAEVAAEGVDRGERRGSDRKV